MANIQHMSKINSLFYKVMSMQTGDLHWLFSAESWPYLWTYLAVMVNRKTLYLLYRGKKCRKLLQKTWMIGWSEHLYIVHPDILLEYFTNCKDPV